MKIFLDCETVPGQTEAAKQAAAEATRPPATFKKAESIAAWWTENGQAAQDDTWRKQALDATWGEIVSIAAMTDTDHSWVKCRAPSEPERELIEAFFATVEGWRDAEQKALVDSMSRSYSADPGSAWPADPLYLVAHNTPFDIGFLWRRCCVLGIPKPRWLPSPSARAGRDFGDSMTLWAGFAGRISLDNLCRALSIPTPKGDLDGSQVFDAWQAGQTERISTYNMADVVACRAVWERLQ